MNDNYYHLIHAQEKRIAALEAQNAAHETHFATIEQAIRHLLPQPAQTTHQQSDHHLERMLANSSGEVVRDMAAAVGDKLVADIVRDNRGRR